MRALALLLTASSWILAQTPPAHPDSSSSIRSTIDSLYKTQNFREVAISPDGKSVAWTEVLKNANHTDSRNSAIYIAPLNEPRKVRRITAGDGHMDASENSIAWSPDSANIAFLSDAGEQGQRQLYIADVENSAIQRLTSLKGYLADPIYSPNGKEIAFLFTENAPRVAGPLEPSTPELGVIDEKIYEQRLTIINTSSNTLRTISPADMYVYEFDWSPSSQELAYTASHGAGDNNWWIAKLYRTDASGSKPELVCKPPDQIAGPRWSPDGKNITFIGGIMSDEGSTGGDIYSVPALGGPMVNLTPGRKSSAAWIKWIPASGRLLFGQYKDGSIQIATLNPATRETETLWTGDEQIRFGGVAKDGKTSAAIRTSWQHAPEVWAGPLGDWRQVTQANAAEKPGWGKAEKVHWTNGGSAVQGWLLYPSDFDKTRKYPMVISVHGGPASQKSPSWPSPGFDLSVLANQGFFVFYPNPRGSYGQGEAFTKANVKDFGYGDLSDILSGLDEVLRTVPVDPQRVGIAGWSYGGFMTMWAVTQTHRFHAAVAGAGIANWQSYYGQNLIDQWMIPYFGASVYDAPAVYAKSSPINYIKNVKTPTLIVVGDRDAECPMPQSREFWHALRTLGIKTEFVVYPNEGHHFNSPEHVEDVLERTISWFKDNM
jgi:dipeptidyl aminopeptidase/acylaminoacyl peptidase